MNATTTLVNNRCGRLCVLLLLAALPLTAVPVAAGEAPALEPALSQEGQLLVRFEAGPLENAAQASLQARGTVSGARAQSVKPFFFEQGEDTAAGQALAWTCRLTPGDRDVVLARLSRATPRTAFAFTVNGEPFRFAVADLLAEPEVRIEAGGAYLAANLLYDQELGEIDPASVGIRPVGDSFDFVIFCDPHTAEPDSAFNCYLRANIERVNALEPSPAFLLINGDSTGGQGEAFRFESLAGDLHNCRVPALLELGNHETKYKSQFGPGYKHEALANYYAGQKQINSLQKLAYSFDLGRWHFVVWPDPLRGGRFWVAHPHYFEWLARDLQQHSDRPTVLFTHIHPLPLGINPMTNYVNDTQMRRLFLDTVTHHGNVRYVFSGHTHIPLKASMKTARSFRGTQFINLPQTWAPGRNFGEPDFDGKSPAGFTLVSIRGETASVAVHKLDGGVYPYPDTLPEFRPQHWAAWMRDDWELPAGDALQNGGFENGLVGWAPRYIYEEDADPSNICAADVSHAHAGDASLRMFTRRRDYYVPGDNRMTQTINTVRQAVRMQPGADPVVRAFYRLDGATYTPGDDSGACIRVEGYAGSARRMRLAYWIGRGYFRPRGLWSDWERWHHFDITAPPDRWHEAVLNARRDYGRAVATLQDTEDEATEPVWEDLNLDRLVVTLQVWNLNQHVEREGRLWPMRIGVNLDDVEVTFRQPGGGPGSTLDGEPVSMKPEEEIESRWLLSGMEPTPCPE